MEVLSGKRSLGAPPMFASYQLKGAMIQIVIDMKSTSIRTLLAGLVLLAFVSALVGCDAGDTNPVTPDKMEQIRQKDANSRGSFQPKGGDAPTGTTTG